MPTYTEEDITPDIAERWLETCNKMNRKIRWDKVAEYAEIMKQPAGWKLNGQGWSFDTEGVLVDGQHRALAVKKSGVTIRTLVTRGLAPGVRPTVDEGIKRRFMDDLTMNGITNANARESLFRKILAWEINGGLAVASKTKIGRPVMAASYPEYASQITATLADTQRWKTRFPGNNGALEFMFWLLQYKKNFNPGTVEKFFQILTIGSENDENKVLLKVQDELRGEGLYRKDRKQTGAPYQVFWMHRGWNAWIRGLQVVKLRLPDGGLSDPYPPLERAYNLR
jgi:hypothetical protein